MFLCECVSVCVSWYPYLVLVLQAPIFPISFAQAPSLAAIGRERMGRSLVRLGSRTAGHSSSHIMGRLARNMSGSIFWSTPKQTPPADTNLCIRCACGKLRSQRARENLTPPLWEGAPFPDILDPDHPNPLCLLDHPWDPIPCAQCEEQPIPMRLRWIPGPPVGPERIPACIYWKEWYDPKKRCVWEGPTYAELYPTIRPSIKQRFPQPHKTGNKRRKESKGQQRPPPHKRENTQAAQTAVATVSSLVSRLNRVC